jgi:hypothetical protein
LFENHIPDFLGSGGIQAAHWLGVVPFPQSHRHPKYVRLISGTDLKQMTVPVVPAIK